MIDYILPMTGNTACIITSEGDYSEGLAFIKFHIVRTGADLRGNTLFEYKTCVNADDYAAWNESVKVLEQAARRIADYKASHPAGLHYLDFAYVALDEALPELEKLRG